MSNVKHNKENEPVFALESSLEITRVDHSLFLRQHLADGTFGKAHVNISMCIGNSLAIIVEVEAQDGTKGNYHFPMAALIETVVEKAVAEWNAVPKMDRPTRPAKTA